MPRLLAMDSESLLQDATRTVLGVSIVDINREAALLGLHQALRTRTHRKLAFCNAHTANLAWSDAEFCQILKGFTVLPDGVGVDIAARILTGRSFTSNLNGTDFVPELIHSAPVALRIALIGGRPGVAERAAETLTASDSRHSFSPMMDGYGNGVDQAAFLAALERDPVDILLVAMGNPLQERWIARHIDGRHATLAIGVGALFDFLAGDVSRAPSLVRRLRLEWAYRLFLEPRRMFRRYVLGNPLFLARVLALKLAMVRP